MSQCFSGFLTKTLDLVYLFRVGLVVVRTRSQLYSTADVWFLAYTLISSCSTQFFKLLTATTSEVGSPAQTSAAEGQQRHQIRNPFASKPLSPKIKQLMRSMQCRKLLSDRIHTRKCPSAKHLVANCEEHCIAYSYNWWFIEFLPGKPFQPGFLHDPKTAQCTKSDAQAVRRRPWRNLVYSLIDRIQKNVMIKLRWTRYTTFRLEEKTINSIIYEYNIYVWLCYILCFSSIICMITSSTAQGGGGSFKNRKRIGEIDCCEWRMSKQKHWPTD